MIRQTKAGHWIIDGDSHIGKWVEDEGRLDHDYSLQKVLPLIPVGGVVVDAGAYIGDHTVAYLRKVGPTGKVHAFEPNPEAWECLIRNCPQAKCYQCGLGAMDTGSILVSEGENYGAFYLNTMGSEGKIVSLRTLDSLNLPRLDYLKLDIEGYEPLALKGSEETLKRCSPIMLIEVNRGALARNLSTPRQLLHQIEGYGYKIRNLHSGSPLSGEQFDIICTPS